MGPNSLNLRVNGEFVTTEEIGDVVLANREGRIVYLHEVATVRDGFADETAISRVNGRQGVTLTVQKQTDANTVQVRSEEHTSELQSRGHLVCRLLLEKQK